jgi:hypothetical protein
VRARRYEPKQEDGSDGQAATAGGPADAAAAASKAGAAAAKGSSAAAAAAAASGSGSKPAGGDGSSSSGDGGLGPLATFLVHRACGCAAPYSFANFCYWFLKVEAEADEKHGPMFRQVFTSFAAALPAHIATVLADQHAYVDKVSECQSLAFQTKGNRDVKQREMSKLLKDVGVALRGKRAPSPVNPRIVLTGVDANVKMYQSALYPAAVTFRCAASSFVVARSMRSHSLSLQRRLVCRLHPSNEVDRSFVFTLKTKLPSFFNLN